jgi:DnaD/phage-associated family protein
MNYLTELNAFYDWLMYNSLPTGVIALWHALMAINNKAGWADEFTVANLVLQGMTGLSRQGLDRARNTLIQKGLIVYKKGTSNQAGRYKILSFECKKIGTGGGTREETKNLECKIIGTERYTKRAQQQAQSGHSSSTLNKLNKTKLNDVDVDNPQTPFQEVVNIFNDSGMGDLNQTIGEVLGEIADNNPMELIEEAFKIARLNHATSIRYVEKILIAWNRKGIKTIEELEKHDSRGREGGGIKSSNALTDREHDPYAEIGIKL